MRGWQGETGGGNWAGFKAQASKFKSQGRRKDHRRQGKQENKLVVVVAGRYREQAESTQKYRDAGKGAKRVFWLVFLA